MPKTLKNTPWPFSLQFLAFRALIAGVLCLPGGVFAQQQPSGLGLKLEDQLLVRPPVPDEDAPTFTSSKKLDGVFDRQMRLEGDAVVRRNQTIVKGDVIVYDPDTDIADVEGNASIAKDGRIFKGPKAKYRMDAQEGWMESPNYELKDIGGNGKAKRVEFFEGEQMELEKPTYTTCRPDSVDWYLSASRMEVDPDSKRATGSNGVLHFFNVPVLYTPVFALPTTSERRSGFLAPTYGYATRGNWSGWDVTAPYYLNIAPNRDLTLFPRYLQNRGVQLGGEFRYLDRQYGGILSAEVLPSDKVTQTDRWSFGIKHNQLLSPGLVAYTDYSRVSDNGYVDDLGRTLNGVVTRQFNQEAGVRYVFGPWSVLTRVQQFQTLQPDLNNPIIVPYQREPQVNVRYVKNNWNGFNMLVETDATRFTYPGIFNSLDRRYQQGDRAYVTSSVARPFIDPGYYITPKVTVRSTQYSLDPFSGSGITDKNRNVTLPTLSLDSGLVFERKAAELKPILGRNMLMTLEPRMLYVYTPYKSQSDLPLFDTADAGFGISQIFSENSFVGNDRIADNNKVTFGVTSRILDAETGIERMRAVLAQRIDMGGQRLGLYADQITVPKKTDILGGLATRLAGNFNLDTTLQYNPNLSRIVQSSVTASYRPDYRKVLNVGYRNTYDPNISQTSLNQVELSAQWPLAKQWYGVARYNYDLISSTALNRLAGVEYDADCWVVRFVQRKYQNTTTFTTSEFYMQIEFKGFSGFGTNPISLVRFNVPGYEPVSSLPPTVSPFERYE